MHAEVVPYPTPVVTVDSLTRTFGQRAALCDVRLAIPKGIVFGLVGTNGAGKTTLIKHVLGLMRAETGTVRVFGLDPVRHPKEVLERIGYMAEVNELPEWMSVGELVRFTRAFYPMWDESYAASLAQTFELDPAQHVGKLSKGQRARLSLLLALAHRPELLVLDEPSSGLDPLVRRDILRAIIRTIADEGRTVLLSSHLLDEVERVADRVAIIHRGRIVENDDLESLRASFHRIVLRFAEGRREPPVPDGRRAYDALDWQGTDREWSALFRGRSEDVVAFARRLGAELVTQTTPSLNEIFVALIGAQSREHVLPA